jgi:hypothetical protein
MLPEWHAAQVKPILSDIGLPVVGSAPPTRRANPTGKPSKFSAGVGFKWAADSGMGGEFDEDE